MKKSEKSAKQNPKGFHERFMRLAVKWRRRLRMDDWMITVYASDELEDDASADTWASYRYLKARTRYSDSLWPDLVRTYGAKVAARMLETLVIHELLHAKLAPVAGPHYQLLETLQRERESYDNLYERAVEELATAIYLMYGDKK